MSKPIPEGTEITDAITKHMDRRFLSSVDLAGHGAVEMTIAKVTKHARLQYENGQTDTDALLMHFEEVPRPLKLNATNIKAVIIKTGTSKVGEWKGKKIHLAAVAGRYFGEEGLAVRVVDSAGHANTHSGSGGMDALAGKLDPNKGSGEA